MSTTATKPPIWFWIVSALSLLWNIGGLRAFVMQITMSADTLQAMSEEERSLYTDIPMWVMTMYAIAVIGATLASVLLLMRRNLAKPIFLISFIAIVLQMGYNLFVSKAIEIKGAAFAALPISVILIGGLLVWFSRTASTKGWIK